MASDLGGCVEILEPGWGARPLFLNLPKNLRAKYFHQNPGKRSLRKNCRVDGGKMRKKALFFGRFIAHHLGGQWGVAHILIMEKSR